MTATRVIHEFSQLDDVPDGDGVWVRESGVLVWKAETDFELSANKGVAGGYASLDSGGLIPSVQLPPIAITTVDVVASEAAMLALDVTKGAVAVRSDVDENFILATADPTQIGNWVELLSPPAPVQSVDGQTGTVDLSGVYDALGAAAAAQAAAEVASVPATYLDTDGTLAADSDSKVASQKATKTYVDGLTGLEGLFVSGCYYGASETAISSATSSYSGLASFLVGKSQAFSSLGLPVSAGVVGASVTIFVASSDSRGKPSAIVASAVIDASTSGWKEVASAFTLPPGLYWLGGFPSGAANVQTITMATSSINQRARTASPSDARRGAWYTAGITPFTVGDDVPDQAMRVLLKAA